MKICLYQGLSYKMDLLNRKVYGRMSILISLVWMNFCLNTWRYMGHAIADRSEHICIYSKHDQIIVDKVHFTSIPCLMTSTYSTFSFFCPFYISNKIVRKLTHSMKFLPQKEIIATSILKQTARFGHWLTKWEVT